MIFAPDGPELPLYAWWYVAGRNTTGGLPLVVFANYHTHGVAEEYFWRGFFEARGKLQIYGEIGAGEEAFTPVGKNAGPRARVTVAGNGSAALLDSFVDFLAEGGFYTPWLNAHRAQCSAGRLTFSLDQTIALVGMLYNDEQLQTDRAFMAIADRIRAWK